MQRVKALAEALEGSEVSELDLTEGGLRVLLRRRLNVVISTVTTVPTRAAGAMPAGFRQARAGPAAGAPEPEPGVAIVAPLTGVYYESPSPSSAVYVEIGDAVQVGQVICLIEAMKVFNEIKSEVSGTLVKRVATNGQIVHKGDVLLRVTPA